MARVVAVGVVPPTRPTIFRWYECARYRVYSRFRTCSRRRRRDSHICQPTREKQPRVKTGGEEKGGRGRAEVAGGRACF